MLTGNFFILKPSEHVMELLNISKILPFHQHRSDRDSHEENEGGGLPVRSRVEALPHVDAKPFRQRQGTLLEAFFNSPCYVEALGLSTVNEYPASFHALMPPFMDHT